VTGDDASQPPTAKTGGLSRRQQSLAWLIATLMALTFAAFAWASDHITLKGERTIYSARCIGGSWDGDRCEGRLVAGERYRFRALKGRGEVFYWTVGSRAKSSKLSGCAIVDGRNWRCTTDAGPTDAITHEMRQGRAVSEDRGEGPRFHPIPKWKWFFLRWTKDSHP
jgi:hypothetical protein